MAYRQHLFQFQNVYIDKSHSLGSGSFGAVYKAKGDQLPCAAKILHSVLTSSDDTPYSSVGPYFNIGHSRIMERFQTECHLLSLVRHPNIVQYLSTSFDAESGLPVLLMELCDESLTDYLERSPGPLPYHTELSISRDIALALAYLHTNGLIHRDLSSNNVLMDCGRAKVTDFGMSKLVSIQPQRNSYTQTICPGSMFYMPPEALDEPAEENPSCMEKLDVFSFGVLLVQIMTREFPDPGPRFRVIHDPRYATGIRIPIGEVERRYNHIVLIHGSHPLKSIALQCLNDDHGNRPTSQELSTKLEVLKAAQSIPKKQPSRVEMGSWSQQMAAQQTERLEEQLVGVTLQLAGQRISNSAYRGERENNREEQVEEEKLEELLEKEKKLEELKAKEKMWEEEKKRRERREKDLRKLRPVVYEVQRSLSEQEQKFGKLKNLLEEVLDGSTAAGSVQNSASLTDSSKEIQQDERADGTGLETEEALKCILISELELGDQLAKGGQATVWKGMWGRKEVAVKKYTNQPDPRDICILQQVPPHPNIVTVLGVVRDKFSCSIVMELMRGGSLYDFIHRKKNTPSPHQRFSWMKDIAT